MAQTRLSHGLARTGQYEAAPCNNYNYEDMINKLIIDKMIEDLIPLEEYQNKQDSEIKRLEDKMQTSPNGTLIEEIQVVIDEINAIIALFSYSPYTTWSDFITPPTLDTLTQIFALPDLPTINTEYLTFTQKVGTDIEQCNTKLETEIWPTYFTIRGEAEQRARALIKLHHATVFLNDETLYEALVNLIELYPLFAFCSGLNSWGDIHDPTEGRFYKRFDTLGNWDAELYGTYIPSEHQTYVYIEKIDEVYYGPIYTGYEIGLKPSPFDIKDLLDRLEKMYQAYGKPKHIKLVISYITSSLQNAHVPRLS